MTEPSKINQIAVLIWPCFKLNKAQGFELLYFTLGQIVRNEIKQDMVGFIFRTYSHGDGMQEQGQGENHRGL